MASNRTPGPLGLWPEDDDALARAGGPWEAWPSRPALPAGSAADALDEPGPLGLASPPLAPSDDAAEQQESGPIERFRYMEIQGEVVKVRCVPLWQNRILGMLGGSDEDDKALERLMRTVNGHKAETRAKMVEVLMAQLNEEGRAGGPTAGRLAGVRLPKGGEAEGGGDEGSSGAGERAGRMAQAGDGRSVLNG